MHLRTARFVLCGAILAAPAAAVGQTVTSLVPERIEEALRLGADEAAAKRFLAGFIIQTHGTIGNGPMLGQFTTPFARIVRASLAAKRAGRVLSAADVPEQLLAREVHVIAVTQHTVDDRPAVVRTIALWSNGVEMSPMRTQQLNAAFKEAFALDIEGDGLVAVFPVDGFAAASEIIVHLDKVAQGATPISACKDCLFPIPSRLIR